MKFIGKTLTTLIAVLMLITTNIKAQDEQPEESSSPFTIGADIVSNYIWRGSKLSPNPSFQPTVKFEKSGFTAGVWGSFDFASGYAEADPYISYATPFGLTVGISDYYNCGLDLYNVSDTAGSHGVELNAGYSIKGFSLSANYIVNEAPGIGTIGGDMYFQAGYAVKNVSIFVGAGDGWHTEDNDFAVCNIGLGVTRQIEITDRFKLPVFGQLIVNPDKKNLFLVFGFTL